MDQRTCVRCQAEVIGGNANTKYCSEKCKHDTAKQMMAERNTLGTRTPQHPCARCNTLTTRPKYCSLNCYWGWTDLDGKRRVRRASKASDRARRRDARTIETFDPHEIFERDGWRCQLCGKAVTRTRPHPHPRSPSIDHIIPVSHGGTHTRSNVRCAHLRCNTARGNRGGPEQLMLVG